MENKELQGVMFPNDKPTDKSPDFKGSCKIGGVDYYVAAWKRTSQYGKEYVSLAFTKKEPKQKQATPSHTPQETVNQVSQAVGGPDDIVSETEGDVDEVLPF